MNCLGFKGLGSTFQGQSKVKHLSEFLWRVETFTSMLGLQSNI